MLWLSERSNVSFDREVLTETWCVGWQEKLVERSEALLLLRRVALVVLSRFHHEFLRVFKHLRCVSVVMQRWRFPFFNDEGVRLRVLCAGGCYDEASRAYV